MASKTAAPQDRFDASKRQSDKVPSFVRIPTGEVEVDESGDLVLDNGEPVFKSQPYLVRRTGSALKQILQREIEVNSKHQQQMEEEDDAFKVEDEGGEKVDMDWLAGRQQARTKETIDLTYESLSLLLCSPADGSHPDPEMLSETLDYMTAAEWMRVIVPPPEMVPTGETNEDGSPKTKPESPTEAGSETGPGASS